MLRREAARWLARLQSGREPDVQKRFRHWCDADPRHAAAFDSVQRSYEKAGLLRQLPIARAEAAEVGTRSDTRAPRYAWAAAAALVVLVPGGIFLTQRGTIVGGTHAAMLVTGVGEIRSVALNDGSKVTLDTATRLEVTIGRTQRRARLRQGRARFEVVRGRQPFVVEAGGTTVTTDGSVFDVARTEEESRVDVLSGTADVRSSGDDDRAAVKLRGGEGVTAEPKGMERTRIVLGGTDWTRGMLEFDGAPLGAAVALANRYSQQKIVVAGDIAQLRVTGAFRTGDAAGLAKTLAAAFDLSLGRGGDGNFILSRKGAASPQKKNGG